MTEEDFDEKTFDDPNFRELPLASDIPMLVKNNPPPWTAELNLNYPTKDRVIAMSLLIVVFVLLSLIVF